MRASISFVLALSVLGCDGHDDAAADTAPPPTSAVAVVPRPIPQPPPPPEPTIVTQGQYYAVFLGDELDRCVERTRRYEIPFDVAWAPRALPPIEPVPEGRVIELQVDCSTSFEGRTVLASCEGSWDLTRYEGVDAGIGTPATGVTMLESLTTRSYRFETALATDARLEDCIAEGRRWTAVSDDSVELVRARSQAHERARSRPR
jgi:hypothetical protein